MKPIIPGKLLLFGEYALLHGGNALSIPYPCFNGQLCVNPSGSEAEKQSHQTLLKYHNFLKSGFEAFFNFNEFERDLSLGLYFKSSIPQGYGVGSSGALVAAILKEYGLNIPEDLEEKKNIFGRLESYFHGKSSGLDVLVCYENRGIIIQKGVMNYAPAILDIFNLIDSQTIGITSKVVGQFNQKDQTFLEAFKKTYLAASNNCIAHLLSGHYDLLFEQMKQLSVFTFEQMRFAIPKQLYALWEASLNDPKRVLKLCGSGGGGFFIEYLKP